MLGASLSLGYVGYTVAPYLWTVLRNGRKLRHGPGGEIALTFDDGPDPRYTPMVLETLARFNIKASFFMLGVRAQRYPDLVREVAAAGHDIGSHSFNHVHAWLQPPWRVRRELMRGQESLSQILGRPPHLFRPPWGAFNLMSMGQISRQQTRPVLWSVRANEMFGYTPTMLVQRRIARRTRPGAIVLMHDGAGFPGRPDRALRCLPTLIPALQERGFVFVPLSEWWPEPPG